MKHWHHTHQNQNYFPSLQIMPIKSKSIKIDKGINKLIHNQQHTNIYIILLNNTILSTHWGYLELDTWLKD